MSASAVPESLLGIGQVLNELKEEFPSVSLSQIRYYHDQGLVEPQRTSSGYRKFTYSDVERLRFVLRMQKDRFWSLNHIRQVLDQIDRGEAPDMELKAALQAPQVALAPDGMPAAATMTEPIGLTRLTREELLDAAGIEDEMLKQLEEFELVRTRPRQQFYDADALAVATLAGQLAALGLEPRHLRGFRVAADRELGLIEQVVPSSMRQQDQAAGRIAELAALSVRLHTVLVRSGLRG